MLGFGTARWFSVPIFPPFRMLLLQLFLNHGDDAVLTLIDAPFVSTIKFELKCLFHIDYPVLLSKVSRVAWWMHHYLGPTPKRHYLYSNSPVVARLDKGKLQGWRNSSKKGLVKTSEIYIKNGKKCYKGTAALRRSEPLGINFMHFRYPKSWFDIVWISCSPKTCFYCSQAQFHQLQKNWTHQIVLGPGLWYIGMLWRPMQPNLREYPEKFGIAMSELYDDLVTTVRGRGKVPDKPPPALDSFRKLHNDRESSPGLDFAKLDEVHTYLRRGRHLVIPEKWKPYISKAGCCAPEATQY